jgi:RNA polymerase sigma-70 factor (ECF subfamily)
MIVAWDELWATARTAWPEITVSRDTFVAYLGERLGDTDPAQLQLGDLYLACACVSGDPRALAVLDRRFFGDVGAFIAHIDPSPELADEVRQHLREKLLVAAPNATVKLADYRGRGPLGGWLRVAAVRTALNAVRARKQPVDADADELEAPVDDPELTVLKSRYATELRDAFEATLAALPSDERTVLSMHYLDGLTIDEIGVTYGVHRATVARWLEKSRTAILADTRRRLGKRLQLAGAELDSLIGFARSRLDVSLRRLLAT